MTPGGALRWPRSPSATRTASRNARSCSSPPRASTPGSSCTAARKVGLGWAGQSWAGLGVSQLLGFGMLECRTLLPPMFSRDVIPAQAPQ